MSLAIRVTAGCRSSWFFAGPPARSPAIAVWVAKTAPRHAAPCQARDINVFVVFIIMF
jgi:hypothetical protein